jgi:hypothetical protein
MLIVSLIIGITRCGGWDTFFSIRNLYPNDEISKVLDFYIHYGIFNQREQHNWRIRLWKIY